METTVAKGDQKRVEAKAGPKRPESADISRAGQGARFAFAVRDPRPLTEVAQFWRTAGQASTIGMFVILLIAALSLARPILLPVADAEAVSQAGSGVVAGIVDMEPADPVEGVLISQLVVANEAALKLYRLAWLNNAEYFEASAKYLQLANNATRTVAMLTERLDHHRQGKQQIVVQHTTTVNANQAVVTDSVVTGKQNDAAPSAKLLAAVTDKPMEFIEPTQKETEPVGGGGTKAK